MAGPAPRKPNLLFVAPVMPAPTGNGLAMRGAMMLEALAGSFAIHLLVIPVAGAADPAQVPAFVRERTAAVVIDSLDRAADPLARALASGEPARAAALLLAWPTPLLCRFATAERLARLTARFRRRRFALVHVMRLYMAPYAAQFLDGAGRRPPATALDLDDDEVRTRERIAALREQRGELVEARLEFREAQRFRDLEKAWLGRFDRILVCSEADRDQLAGRSDPSRLAVIPNTVPLPDLPGCAVTSDGERAWTIMFVGTLGYFPNADAAVHLCRDVLPLVR